MSNRNLDIALSAIAHIQSALKTMDASDPKRKSLLAEISNIQSMMETKKLAQMGKLKTEVKRRPYKPVATEKVDSFFQNVKQMETIEADYYDSNVSTEKYEAMLAETRVLSKELDKVEDLLRVLLSIKPTIDGVHFDWNAEDNEYMDMAQKVIDKCIGFPMDANDETVKCIQTGIDLRSYLRKNALIDGRQVDQYSVRRLPGSLVQVLGYFWNNQTIPTTQISNNDDVVRAFRKRVSENVVFASPESPDGQSLQTIFKLDDFAVGKLDEQIVPVGGLDKAFKVVTVSAGVNVVSIDLNSPSAKIGVHTYLASSGKGKYIYLVKRKQEWYLMTRCPGKTSFKCEVSMDKPIFI